MRHEIEKLCLKDMTELIEFLNNNNDDRVIVSVVVPSNIVCFVVVFDAARYAYTALKVFGFDASIKVEDREQQVSKVVRNHALRDIVDDQ